VYLSDSGSISSIYEELSDPEDPAHDQEILDLLFYRKSTSQRLSAEKVLSYLLLCVCSWVYVCVRACKCARVCVCNVIYVYTKVI